MVSLPDNLAPNTVLKWRSARCQSKWETRLCVAAECWQFLEIMSVVCGLRLAAISALRASPDAELTRKVRDAGLVSLLLPTPPIGRRQYIVARPRIAEELRDMWDRADHDRIGLLLGTPQCCRRGFQRQWISGADIEPTWGTALNSRHERRGCHAKVQGYDEANIMVWPLGIRAVPYRPCSFDCPVTSTLGKEYLSIAEQNGRNEAAAIVRSALAWPAFWTMHRGFVKITTPVVAAISRDTRYESDAAYTVHRRASRRQSESQARAINPYGETWRV